MSRPNRATLGALVAVAGASLALAACGGDDEPATTTTATATTTATTSTQASKGRDSCEQVAPAEPKSVKLKPPKDRVERSAEITATVATNCGEFEFALETKDSPKTASWFVQLVEQGVYDRTAFNRVVPNFLIQGGDVDGDDEYLLAEEPPVNTEYTRGTVAMAKTAAEPPGASHTQFFVVTAADAGLPPDYATLGEVTRGEDTVDAIEAQADPALGATGGEPVIPVVIESITLD